MKLLIIDDEPDNVDLLMLVFEAAGHDVVTATSGAEAISAAESEAYDIILTDLSLPGGVDGLEVVRAVRGGARNARVPLVAVTAFSSTIVHTRALDAGCDAVVTKPIVDLPAFVARIEGMVKAS